MSWLFLAKLGIFSFSFSYLPETTPSQSFMWALERTHKICTKQQANKDVLRQDFCICLNTFARSKTLYLFQARNRRRRRRKKQHQHQQQKKRTPLEPLTNVSTPTFFRISHSSSHSLSLSRILLHTIKCSFGSFRLTSISFACSFCNLQRLLFETLFCNINFKYCTQTFIYLDKNVFFLYIFFFFQVLYFCSNAHWPDCIKIAFPFAFASGHKIPFGKMFGAAQQRLCTVYENIE